MPLYLSKSLGGGFRIGTRIGGGYGRKNDGCFLVTIVQAVLFLAIIGLFITYWQIAIALFVLWFIGTVWWGIEKEKAKEREKLKNEIATIGKKIEKHVEMVQNAKTLSARQNNCTKAISLLKEIKSLDPNGNIADTGELLNILSATEKILPIGNILEKAERAEFKGQTQQAMNAYLDALYQCQKENITDTDFKLADLRDTTTSQFISVDYLKAKASDNGWTDTSSAKVSNQAASVDMSQEIECPYCHMPSPYRMFNMDDNGRGYCPSCNVPVEFE